MPYNRLAIYGHRGWSSSAIAQALLTSGAPAKLLYKPSSNSNGLTGSFSEIEVDIQDQDALRAALKDVDILISLVGREAIPLQHAFIKAIPHTDVRLFVPSDLAFRCDEQGLKISVNKDKDDVERAAREAGIATTVILPCVFAESGLNTGLLGVDVEKNRIVFAGDAKNQILNVCTRSYVSKAYSNLFAKTPIPTLQNRTIALSEIRTTGAEIATALEKKHGTTPQIFRQSLAEVDRQIEECVSSGRPALGWYCRRRWGAGECVEALGG
ncbi:uncharacterized protein N7496_000153 [Penicillium cataractarum]|uniref:NmrA-like domain-containing protein n=1 Tax=Penicillium cataractarum TaxID=2100454 RepID=A0A9W9VTR9_9EURO|nr:uncharacterized protein N7496_000153 [Penicillium cataractarum]KAJ5389085.1 hypothetical protein N7496_000153 [Penicillium cataractarum]